MKTSVLLSFAGQISLAILPIPFPPWGGEHVALRDAVGAPKSSPCLREIPGQPNTGLARHTKSHSAASHGHPTALSPTACSCFSGVFSTHPARTVCVGSMKLLHKASPLHGHELIYLLYRAKSFGILRARHSLEQSSFVFAAAISSLFTPRKVNNACCRQQQNRRTNSSRQDAARSRMRTIF